MRGRLTAIAAVTAFALSATGGVAEAAPTWLPTVNVEPTPPISSLVFPVVVARDGGCSSVVFPRSGVLATTRPAGGSFSSPPQILGTLLGGEYPEVGFGGGIAAAVWPDGSSKLRIATAGGCDPFGAAAEVPSTPSSPNHAKVAVDSSGTVVAVVGGGASGSRKVYVSERPQGGAPSAAAPLTIPVGTEAFRPWAATNESGGAGIAFDLIDGGDQVYGSLRSSAGWSTPVKLNEDGKAAVAQTARVVIGPDGVLHATWIDATNGRLIFASLPPGGPPTRETLQEVSAGVITAEAPAAPKIAEDAEGRIAVIWVQEAAGVRTVKAKVRQPGSSTFSGPLNVSPTTNQTRSYPWIAVDRSGRVIAAYSNSPSIGHSDAIGATLEPGAAQFTEPVQLGESTHVTSPSGISTDGDGNTLVAVYKSDGTTEARVAPFDAAGPVMNGLSVPGSGTVGQALQFSVSPLDAWSPLGSTAWGFGDGGTATGNAVSHVFSAPASLQITVLASDSLGNTSQSNGTTLVEGIAGPELSDLKLSKKRFRVAGAATPRKRRAAKGSKKLPVGTRISFRLSEAAGVRLEIDHLGGKKYKLRRGFTSGGVIQLQGRPGLNGIRFNGRFGKRKLITGGYALKATATDSGGNRSAPKSATFAIVGH